MLAKHGSRGQRRGVRSALPNPPVEGGQALPEGAHEGLYPVVAQHHALREAQVELLHGSQRRDVGASVGHQQLQELQEFLLGNVCGAAPSEERWPRVPTGTGRLSPVPPCPRPHPGPGTYRAGRRVWPSCPARGGSRARGRRAGSCHRSPSPPGPGLPAARRARAGGGGRRCGTGAR